MASQRPRPFWPVGGHPHSLAGVRYRSPSEGGQKRPPPIGRCGGSGEGLALPCGQRPQLASRGSRLGVGKSGRPVRGGQKRPPPFGQVGVGVPGASRRSGDGQTKAPPSLLAIGPPPLREWPKAPTWPSEAVPLSPPVGSKGREASPCSLRRPFARCGLSLLAKSAGASRVAIGVPVPFGQVGGAKASRPVGQSVGGGVVWLPFAHRPASPVGCFWAGKWASGERLPLAKGWPGRRSRPEASRPLSGGV
jgi:hypothetical protein